MEPQNFFSKFIKNQAPKNSFQERYSPPNPLRQLISPSGQAGNQESPWRLLFNSRNKKKPLPQAQTQKAQKGPLPKYFKRNDYRDWLQENSKDLSSIFKHRLSKRQIIEKGMAFLPSNVGTGYVGSGHIKTTIKELEKKYRDKAYFKERANIQKDLELVKRYEEKLKGLSK